METLIFYIILIYQITPVQGLATDVRLSHGQNSEVEFRSFEGAIEVLVNDTWGPVLRHGVDSTTAKTVCKLLGHGFTGFVVEQFNFTGRPLLRSLSCVGNETSIEECTQDPLSESFEEYDAPGVHCFPQNFITLRLVDGDGPNIGTVNIFMYDSWGLLCGYPTGNGTATPTVDTVICRTLGYQRTIDPAPRFGQYVDIYNGWLDIDKINCSGSETNLDQCTIEKGTLHRQPRCNTLRAVHCVTDLGEFCISDNDCVSTQKAACFGQICKCRYGYDKSEANTCIAYNDFRLLRVYEDVYEGIVQMTHEGDWMVIDLAPKHNNVTATVLCKTFGISNFGYTVPSNREVHFEKRITILNDVLGCMGHELHATECDKAISYSFTNKTLNADWIKLRCSHCEKGFYGPNCTMCNCNGQPCNVSTGECMCDAEWEGDTCSTDIDECSLGIDTCPLHLVCTNIPGSYSCECESGSINNGSHCEACEEEYYGYNCSYICDCEVERTVQTTTNRSCDVITGNCACIPEWTGRRCNQPSSSGSTDVKMMIIIISSTTVGFIVLVVIITVCVCKYRKSGPKGEDKSSIPTRGTVNTVNESSKDMPVTIQPADEPDYYTINDHNVGQDMEDETEYDLHRDFLDKPDSARVWAADEAYSGGYDSAGYLKPSQLNKGKEYDYTYADKRPDTDSFGYLELDKGKRELPEIPSSGQNVHYEGLKSHEQTDHEYTKMNTHM